MINNLARIGNFTSSEIHRLLARSTDKKSFGKTALSYIQECNFERKLNKSSDTEFSSKPTKWGTALEGYVFENILDTSYRLSSQETIKHLEHDCWAGSPDGVRFFDGVATTVVDIKCPYTLKSFCQLASCTTPEQLRADHKEGEKYYWQLVSNAILLNVDQAELIVYAPFEDELPAIKDYVELLGEHPSKYGFIFFSDGDDLPLLKRGCAFASPHIISFEIPQADKDLLTESVALASKHLIEFNKSELVTL